MTMTVPLVKNISILQHDKYRLLETSIFVT